MYVIEGTWEEVQKQTRRRAAELRGRKVRLVVEEEQPPPTETAAPPTEPKTEPKRKQQKKTSAFGKYAGLLSVDDFLREKQEDLAREERKWERLRQEAQEARERQIEQQEASSA